MVGSGEFFMVIGAGMMRFGGGREVKGVERI